jgi:glycosyltransferase involved in cell wall biosynthesis
MSEAKISVVVPVWNEANKIAQCLKAIFSQSYKPYEVIVVDGLSTDETVDKARQFPVKILYENFRNRAGACQVGIENAQGEYVAFTDADCVPSKEWLEMLLREFDHQIVGVGGGIISVGDSLWEKSINLAFSTVLGSAQSLQGRFFQNSRFVNSISGSNSMYRKKDILRVNGFKTDLLGAEDLELNRRLLRLGKLLYTPKAVVTHNHSWTLKEFAKKMYRYGKERGIVKKWDLQVIPALLIPLLILSLVFTPWIVIVMACLYLSAIGLMGLRFAVGEKSGKLIISVPVVYLIEHGLYSFGLWKGWIQNSTGKLHKKK